MSIRRALMVLLDEHPMYGYQLRQEFENRTGGTWPLNIGQVYTNLIRLQRDGLAEEESRHGDAIVYRLTEAGRRQAQSWWLTPVDRTATPRDEVAIKLSLAVTTPGVDVQAVVARQRLECIRGLLEFTRLKAAIDETSPSEIAWLLILDSMMFAVEGEIRWLDHIEQRLARLVPARPASVPARPASQPSPAAPDAAAAPVS